ncbi:hypothetical protein [Arthrobacter polaris]|uniref:hypothetical protein n=1 Tax=Arthrobacter polaris TaxID=2813727 RepID=UPI001F3BF7B9|nr:hypothetical protein [Arthrobacter polaris]UIK90271.1 hypothetical protein J0916_08425 [Arthrobacter polaris]
MNHTELAYQAVVARRLQWDTLLWQVPTLSLTAQAFLFTIALGSNSSQISRTIAASLSIIVTCLSVTLMARYRQSEFMDASWLHEREKSLDEELRIHGVGFVAMRRNFPVTRKQVAFVPLVPGYLTWVVGLLLFGLAAIVVVVITWTSPELLQNSKIYETVASLAAWEFWVMKTPK